MENSQLFKPSRSSKLSIHPEQPSTNKDKKTSSIEAKIRKFRNEKRLTKLKTEKLISGIGIHETREPLLFADDSNSHNNDVNKLGVQAKSSGSTSSLFPVVSVKKTALTNYDGLSDKVVVRWPEGVPMKRQEINHIHYIPPKLEPFCKSSTSFISGTVHKNKGKVVYLYNAKHDEADLFASTLFFESRFESGNLQKVVQFDKHSYDLYLRQDICSSDGGANVKVSAKKLKSWFYFQVRNMECHAVYMFNIIHINQVESLYSTGIKPLVYSEKLAVYEKTGWHRIGDDVTYEKQTDSSGNEGYNLTFKYTFPYEGDVVYFAASYPYTYSTLMGHLRSMICNKEKALFYEINKLCKSIAGNIIPLVTITSNASNIVNMNKQVVIITARVHPNETPSSWVCKGILDFLTSDAYEACELRKLFVFKIVPMLNPDGVILGNNRISLSGDDLNRKFHINGGKDYPSVISTKDMVKKLVRFKRVYLFCDIHGHSRKHNYFLFGCEDTGKERSDATLRRVKEKSNLNLRPIKEKIFAHILKQHSGDKFCENSCTFVIKASKVNTARAVMWRMGVPLSFTLEISTGGCTQGRMSQCHFSANDFTAVGKEFLCALLEYCQADSSKIKVLTKIIREKICLQKDLPLLSSSSEEPCSSRQMKTKSNVS